MKKIHFDGIKNVNITIDWQMIVLGLLIFSLIFWVFGLRNELKCYKRIEKDQCNLIYGEK